MALNLSRTFTITGVLDNSPDMFRVINTITCSCDEHRAMIRTAMCFNLPLECPVCPLDFEISVDKAEMTGQRMLITFNVVVSWIGSADSITEEYFLYLAMNRGSFTVFNHICEDVSKGYFRSHFIKLSLEWKEDSSDLELLQHYLWDKKRHDERAKDIVRYNEAHEAMMAQAEELRDFSQLVESAEKLVNTTQDRTKTSWVELHPDTPTIFQSFRVALLYRSALIKRFTIEHEKNETTVKACIDLKLEIDKRDGEGRAESRFPVMNFVSRFLDQPQ